MGRLAKFYFYYLLIYEQTLLSYCFCSSVWEGISMGKQRELNQWEVSTKYIPWDRTNGLLQTWSKCKTIVSQGPNNLKSVMYDKGASSLSMQWAKQYLQDLGNVSRKTHSEFLVDNFCALFFVHLPSHTLDLRMYIAYVKSNTISPLIILDIELPHQNSLTFSFKGASAEPAVPGVKLVCCAWHQSWVMYLDKADNAWCNCQRSSIISTLLVGLLQEQAVIYSWLIYNQHE